MIERQTPPKMDLERAKFILQSYRPGGRDDGDTQIAEALILARENPDLTAWLEEQCALDATISRKLKSADVPPGLLAQIHTGVALRRARRRLQYLALAACFALFTVLAGLWFANPKPKHTTAFAACRQDMADFLKQFPRLDAQTERLAEIRQWLAHQHAITRFELPVGLEKFPGIGCRTVEWRGKKLALVCFMVDGEVVHLFVLPRQQFPGTPLNETPQFATLGEMTTGCWQKGDLVYLAITKGDEPFLRRYL